MLILQELNYPSGLEGRGAEVSFPVRTNWTILYCFFLPSSGSTVALCQWDVLHYDGFWWFWRLLKMFQRVMEVHFNYAGPVLKQKINTIVSFIIEIFFIGECCKSIGRRLSKCHLYLETLQFHYVHFIMYTVKRKTKST